MHYNESRRSRRRNKSRFGYTLLEIMTAVTLGLMLMYAVAKIFSRVGGQMNETMSTMEMNNALRNAKNRLTVDLEALSVTPQAPRNSRMNEGYLCYVEGLGGPFSRVAQNYAQTNAVGFATADVALDTERYERNLAVGAGSDDYDEEFNSDNTIGDLDDILSFTAKAPNGQPFRGRYVKPIYGYDAEGNRVIVDGVPSTYESQYAEIVWFVRGTTLYRRVLPLIPNDELQASLDALQVAVVRGDHDDSLASAAYGNVRRGFGFYSFYDCSVHLDSDGNVAANSLGDLTNRENRYFYWNSCAMHAHPDDSELTISPAPLHGANDAWYWLRMATLQESAAPNFRAGAPFGQDYFARDSFLQRNAGTYGGFARQLYGGPFQTSSDSTQDYWAGAGQKLTFTANDNLPHLTAGTYSASNLPQPNAPFIDFWNNANVWDEVNYETGDIATNAADMNTNGNNDGKTYDQDVILTNVVSFNVKVWDANCNAYVDLGSCDGKNDANGYFVAHNDPNDFRSLGFYGDKNQGTNRVTEDGSDVFPWLPAVYDTWTEQYQRDFYLYDEIHDEVDDHGNRIVPFFATGALADVQSDGTIPSSQLKNLPPPYDQRIKSMQIELRVFDPRSKHIRNVTFNVDLSSI